MTAETRKALTIKESIQTAITRYEFTKNIDLSDPYAKLAAAVILQGLLDNLHGFGGVCFFDPRSHEWRKSFYAFLPKEYEIYADGIGLEVPYPELLKAMEYRMEICGTSRLPRCATAWMDASL